MISQEIIENKTVYITWLYESDQELFSLLCISKNIKEHFPWLQQALVMPYIPNARFDRVKEPSECFTLKYFAEIINSLGFVRVIVTDPHSDVSTALIDHVEVIRGASYITQTCSKVLKAEPSRNLVIYFPDSGSLKDILNLYQMIIRLSMELKIVIGRQEKFLVLRFMEIQIN